MTSSLLTKGALGLGAASATAAGAAYAGGAFSPSGELISKLIKTSRPDKRVIIATAGTDTNWKEAWKLYRQDNKSKNLREDVWKLKDGKKPATDTINNDVSAPTSFIEECKTRLSKKVSGTESDLYKEVLRYCTRDTLVKDLIEESSGKRLLDSTDGKDTEAWNAAGGVYKTNNNVSGKDKDTGEFSDGSEKKGGNTLPQNFKTKCDEKAKVPAFKLENENYKNVLSGCTTNK